MTKRDQIVLQNDGLRESYLQIRHESGLTLLLYPNTAYSTTTACFAVRYGSQDNRFASAPGQPVLQMPEGIAHFLEHKLFEDEQGDAFERFSKTGASANAFTSYDKTVFYFSCTDHFEDNLEILLNFVQTPYFTEKSVQKEQGIIAQEIRMYDDNPDWRVYFGLLRALYQKHSIRIDTAGSVSSIEKITPKLLYSCYETFYRPENMVLTVAGKFDPDVVLACCDRLIRPNGSFTAIRLPEQEPEAVCTPVAKASMPVSKPQFCIGLKQNPAEDSKERLFRYTMDHLAMECLFGDSTEFYRDLYENGKINSCFGSSVLEGNGFLAMLCEGESDDCAGVGEEIRRRILSVQKNGVNPALFEGIRRTEYGRQVKQFNTPSELAVQLVDACFCSYTLFDTAEILRKTDEAQLNQFIREQLSADRMAMNVISPLTAQPGTGTEERSK